MYLDISHNQDISEVNRSFIIEKLPVRTDSVAWNVDVVLNNVNETYHILIGLLPPNPEGLVRNSKLT